mmetsp:Transcript_17101/g.22594  ORF Transcript_17101/g.22594 Transcript_17101/m.22594 type:complete len:251 (+) Transcript_17101:109-861(+)
MKNTACIMKYCKFHFSKEKKCKFGNRCKFVHDKNILIPCAHFMNKEKQCTQGEGCWYLHLVSETEVAALSKCILEMECEFSREISAIMNENLELRQKIEEYESIQKSYQGMIENRLDFIEKNMHNDKQIESEPEIPNSEEKIELDNTDEIGEEISFQVGEMVEIYHDKFQEPQWSEGLIRNRNSEGCYDIQTLFYTFWNFPEEKIRHLENEKLEQNLIERNKLNAKFSKYSTPITVKYLKRKLSRMKMKS